jgi:hypothetical protein
MRTEIDSRTSHDQSVRKSVGSSTRGRRFTTLWHRMPWPQGCSSINSPHLPKDNEEVNAHVKRLQAMLDAATMVDPTLDRDDEARDHEPNHQQSPHRVSASSLTPMEERG